MSNILPLQQKKDIKKMKRLRFSIVGVALSIAIAGIVLVLFVISSLLLRTERDSLALQIHTARNSTQAQEVDTAIVENIQKISALEKAVIAKESKPLYSTMQVILNTTQPGIRVSSVSFAVESNSIRVEGVAQDRTTLETFTAYLKGLPQVTGVDSPLSNFIKSTQSPFSLTVVF